MHRTPTSRQISGIRLFARRFPCLDFSLVTSTLPVAFAAAIKKGSWPIRSNSG